MWRFMRVNTGIAAVSILWSVGAVGQEPRALSLAPWLDVPESWTRVEVDGRLIVVPPDLPADASFRFTVEPLTRSDESLIAAYERTIEALGGWRPVGSPMDQSYETGWAFHFGIGVLEAGGETYTSFVAIGGKDGWLARFWGTADSDNTYNRYQGEMMTGVASLQDVVLAAEPDAGPRSSPGPLSTGPVLIAAADGEFGKGITGAYLGLERGLRASASAGGLDLMLDLATNFLSVGADPGAPQLQTSLQDYPEVDLFLPDHRYRRGLPIRGLRSDLDWDREQQPSMWGRWDMEGDRIVTRRGSYVTTYGIGDETLISERDRPWRKLPLWNEVRLEGSFARVDYRDAAAPRLVLHEDGSYEDRGGFLRMVGSSWNLVVPDGGALSARWTDAEAGRALGEGRGSYTFSGFTLTLQDVDGRVWQINAYVPPTGAKGNARYLVINGYALVRD